MKKIVVLLITLVVAFTLTSCFKSNELEENKIMAPVPNKLDIDGTWEITAQYTIGDNNQLEKIEDIQKPIITISNQVAIVGDSEIDNPKFKFKRVVKENYLPKAFDGVVNNVPLSDSYMNIITISDNTNIYLDFILKNENEGYIYAVGDLLAVKRIDTRLDQSEINAANNKNSNAYIEEKNKQDTGVLIGLKKQATISSSGEIIPSTYTTLWISMINGKVQKPITLNGLLLPRMNGTFSDINMSNTDVAGNKTQTLTVTNKNKNDQVITQKNSMLSNVNREITFVGKDYIGLEYYNGNDFNNTDNKYEIIPVDNIESGQSLDMTSLFGAKGKNDYINSRDKFIASKNNAVLANYNLNDNSMSNITMFRENARWVLNGMLRSKVLGVSDLPFDINISPVGTLVNYDSLSISWNRLKELNPNITDAFSSPNENFIVTMDSDSMDVYELSDGDINEKPVMTIPIAKGSVSVMSEWATGDFVSTWNRAVEQRVK